MSMFRRGVGYEAMTKRIAEGTEFTSRELEEVAKAAGMKTGAQVLANQITQAEKRLGNIVVVGKKGPAYRWQRSAEARLLYPEPPPPPPPPVLRGPTVRGPLDPDPNTEGANTGLTEQVGDWLFRELGGNGSAYDGEGILRTINPMEAAGWRLVADKLIRRLLDLGMSGPGPRHDVTAGWNVAWGYNIAEWCVQDEEGGFVASLLDGDAAYLVTAAPQMRTAILGVLANYDQQGGVRRSDIEAMRAALPAVPATTEGAA